MKENDVVSLGRERTVGPQPRVQVERGCKLAKEHAPAEQGRSRQTPGQPPNRSEKGNRNKRESENRTAGEYPEGKWDLGIGIHPPEQSAASLTRAFNKSEKR